jgi:hypothetical protein
MRLHYNVPGHPELFSTAGGKHARTAATLPCYPSASETGCEGYLDRRSFGAPSLPNCVGLSTGRHRLGMSLLSARPMSVLIPVSAGELEIGSTTSVAEAWWDHAWTGSWDWMRGIDFGINMRVRLRPSCSSSDCPDCPPS